MTLAGRRATERWKPAMMMGGRIFALCQSRTSSSRDVTFLNELREPRRRSSPLRRARRCSIMNGDFAALTISAEDSAVAFEPDESIGAAVLAHVHDVRDRLALACVSREWRRVAATEGSWGVAHDELVVKGELAKRLTDERLERLMRYCGRLKRVELRDFPSTFKGTFMTKGFTSLHPRVFESLESLVLRSETSSLNIKRVKNFLSRLGVRDRPKAERLDRLHLGGCKATAGDVAFLLECVRHDRDRKKPLEKGALDLWVCDTCERVVSSRYWVSDDSAFEFGDQCDACKKMYCEGCLENMESGPGFKLCDECEITFLCGCPESANRFEDFWAGCCLIPMYGEPGCGAKLCPRCDDLCGCIKDDDYEYFSDDDLDMRFD